MRFCGIAKLTGMICIALMVLACESAYANGGGSWGSSHGSWGSSHGSWGSSHGSWGGSHGGLFARRPVRNLIGRIGDRLHYAGSHGGYASSGGYASNGGFVGRRYGSWGGSYGSHGSVGGRYAYASTGTVYHNNCVYSPVTSIASPNLNCGGCTISSSQSVPAPTPGINLGTPIQNGAPAEGQGAPTVPDSTPAEPGGTPEPEVGPGGVQTSIQPVNHQRSVLAVNVPEAAQVFINGQRTTTKGSTRRYVADRMIPNKKYRYNVKVVLDRNGQEIVRTDSIVLQPGVEHKMAFDFAPVPTTLTVSVPENAEVVLCGQKTKANGAERSFSTNDLIQGEVWKDYSVVVQFEKNGELVTQTRKIDIVGGQDRQLTFDANDATRVASR